MTDKSSIEDVRRVVSEFEETRTRPDSAFNQFASAVRGVYPDEFDGNLSIRRSYEILREVKDIIKIRTRFQIIGMISIIIGIVSGLTSFGSHWIDVLANAQLIVSVVEYGLLALGLTSIGYAEFGLTRKIRTRIDHIEGVTTENLTHRTLYFGSAQYSIRLGDEGIYFSANRLSAFLSYWAVDLKIFIKENNLPKIDIAPFRDVPLRDVKSGRADGDEFNQFFSALRNWFVSDQKPEFIALPLITEDSLLHRRFREKPETGQKSKNKKSTKNNEPTRLVSETLVVPLAPFVTNRDSDINPVEFVICLYFAISRAHLDRINIRLKKPDET